MRIVHLLKHCDRGNGHVHVAVDLACEQASRGHEVVYASGGGTYVSLLERNGVRHALIPQNLRSAPASFVRLRSLLTKHRSQIVHAHMMSSAALAYAVTRVQGRPLLTTVHNSFDKHSGLMRLGDHIAVVSEAERRLLVSRGYDERRLTTVHNGPLGSVRETLSPDHSVTVPQPYVMTLSGLHSRKRVGDVIDAFAAVLAEVPADWRLAIVGSGPDEAKLKTQVDRKGMSDRVIFVGATLNPGPLLRRASVFINMAEAEPFGLVVAEARAAGCAVIASDAGGMPEVVENGKAGILVPVGGIDQAAQALRLLMTSTSALDYWRRAAVLAPGQFSVGAMAAEYDRVYALLAETKRW